MSDQAMAQQTGHAGQWISRHRQAIIIGAAAVVACGAGFYFLSSSSSSSSSAGAPPSGTDGAEKDKEREKKHKKRKHKSKKAKTSPSQSGTEEQPHEEGDPLYMNEAEIEILDEEQRTAYAVQLKGKGNKLYSSKQYQEALKLYSKALEFEEQAVFYSNRAACYTNLGQHDKVIADCTSALKLDPAYIKALNRRAHARETLGGTDNLYQALCDFTAAAIIDNFATESTQASVERVMKTLANEQAQEIMKTREPKLPSGTFIKAYLEAFRAYEPAALSTTASQGDKTMKLAYDALEASDYRHSLTLFNEAIEQGLSTERGRAEALNMRATFKFIMSNAAAALEDLDESTRIWSENPQAWVKKASVHMELGKPEEAFKDFDRALEIDERNADVYYHRGQVYFITGEFDKAIADYRKSTEIDPTFIFSHIQMAVAQYKSGSVEKALAQFRRLARDFPTKPEVYNYQGELLLDQQRHDEAVKSFEKAIELGKDSRPRNVLPMINRGLALFQWRQDYAAAERECRQAIEIDPECDVGVATLAQLLLQQNKVVEAVDMFKRSAELARTEAELVNALTYENATKAQIAFIDSYPTYAAKLGLNRSSVQETA